MMSPKDKDDITKKNSVIYSYSCGRIDCEEEYLGESGRTFGERLIEHLKSSFQYLYTKTAVAMKQQ